jgi:3-hydroxyisobutyrate dehydrogenase-like beta-hydroxyacid dehydrogenase
MMKVGLLGCGNIGHIIAEHATGFTITSVYDVVPERARETAGISGARAYADFESFIKADIDIVVEAASVVAVWMHAQDVLLHHKKLIIMILHSGNRSAGQHSSPEQKFTSRAGQFSGLIISKSAGFRRSPACSSGLPKARHHLA